MKVQFSNLMNLQGRQDLFASGHFHTWAQGVPPGTTSKMHKHPVDEQLYCVTGQGSISFDDGSSGPLVTGMLVKIPAHQLYQLHNPAGHPHMVLLASRPEPLAKT